MSQFDVHRSRQTGSLVVDCQTDFLSHLPTRLVVPLLPLAEAPGAAERLNPILMLAGEKFHFAPQYAASVLATDLGPALGSLGGDHLQMTSALDFLIGGF